MCLFIHVIDVYITYELDLNTDFTPCNCLFRAVKLTKNVDSDKYGYIDYGVGFDACSKLPLESGNWGKNVVIFGADMSSSVHVDNKRKISQLLVKVQHSRS